MKRIEVEGYLGCCRRCRAKSLLVCLEERKVVFEHSQMWECPKTMGLKREEESSNVVYGSKSRWTWEEHHAMLYNYERWKDIFERLGI
jgi:hypothetical protein